MAPEGSRAPRPWPFRFGLNLAFASLGYMLLTNANLLILTPFVSKDGVGTYSVMLQVATLTSGAVLGLVLAIAYPPLRRSWDSGQQEMVHARLRALQTLTIAIAAGFVFVSFIGDSVLLRLVFPSDYVDVSVLAPLIIGTAFATMGGMASWHHQLQLESVLVARRTVIAAAAGIALTFLLTLVFHERGAAAGSALGFLLYLVIMQVGTRLPAATVILGAITAAATSALFFFPTASSYLVSVPALVLCALALFLALRLHRRSDDGSSTPAATGSAQNSSTTD